jgi:hypothetical protein
MTAVVIGAAAMMLIVIMVWSAAGGINVYRSDWPSGVGILGVCRHTPLHEAQSVYGQVL